MVFQGYGAMMTLNRTRTEKAELVNTYNLQQFFRLTIGNTGSVKILAMKLTVI